MRDLRLGAAATLTEALAAIKEGQNIMGVGN